MKYKTFATRSHCICLIFAENDVNLANGEMENCFITGICEVSTNFAPG